MFIVIDTETTSLLAPEAAGPAKQPHIIEFAALKLGWDMVEMDSLHLWMNPRVPITQKITEVTGFTDEMVKGYKPFIAQWKTIAFFFRGADILVGHNLMFDKKVLMWELVRIDKHLNFPWCEQDICTVDETQKLLGHRLSLTDLHQRLFGKAFDGAHGAMADARATAACFRELRRVAAAPSNVA